MVAAQASHIVMDPAAARSPDLNMVTGAMYLNTGPGCYRATDPDMVLCCSSGLDSFTAPGGSAVHPDLYGPGGSMNLGQQQGLKCWLISKESVQTPVVTGATDIDTNPG